MLENLHLIVDIASGLSIIVGGYIGLLIKNAIQKMSSDAERHNAILKEELVEHNNRVKNDLAVHQAEDKLEFRNFRESIARVESAIVAMVAKGKA